MDKRFAVIGTGLWGVAHARTYHNLPGATLAAVCGPKGVGALYMSKGVTFPSFLHGGRQELGRRASTENVPGIVGLGEAARLAQQDMAAESAHVGQLRDTLLRELPVRIQRLHLTGHPSERLPNNASFCVTGVEGEALVLDLDAAGFAVSSGSPCTSGCRQVKPGRG